MQQSRNIFTLVLIAFALSIQFWLISIFLLQHFPLNNALGQSVFPEWWYLVRPEHDALHFHLFVVAALGLTAMILWRLHLKLTDASFMHKARVFLALEIVWTFLLLSAAFRTIALPGPSPLAIRLFWIIAAMSLGGKIFFKPFSSFLQSSYQHAHSASSRLLRLVEIIFPILLVLILYVPDAKGVMARDFMGEQFHHWDSAVMSPAWSFLSGVVLNVDVISQYGLGLPIIIAQLSKLLGSFSYEHVFQVMLWGVIFYYLGWYFLLRYWLRSPAIAAAGILFAVKIQMFHSGTYPFIFTYPSDTIFRYALDVVFFALMFGHLKSGKNIYLLAASAVCGASVFYMTTTGISMTLTWIAYLISLLVFPDLRRRFSKNAKEWAILPACLVVILLAALTCFWMAEGQHVFTAQFWRNMQEFNNYFLSGFGDVPMQQNIVDHNYLPLLMGLLIPLVYMGSFLVITGLYFYRQCPAENLLAAFIAVYGLALYHYFVARTTATSAYGIGLPYAFLLAFWLKEITQLMNKTMRRNVILSCLGLIIYALVTTANYVSYPNIFNLSRNPLVDPLVVNPLPDGRSYFNHLFSQLPLESRLPLNSLGETDEKLRSEKDFTADSDLRSFYDREFDFSQDARLIDDLVPSGGKVALVSSFETKILMDANRPPFFYYVPLIISRPMHMRVMVVTTLYTQGHLQRIISQIETQKPEYIFIERLFRRENIDRVNYQDGSAFLALMHYIHMHYVNFREGHFLMALKRDTQSYVK